MTKKIIMIIEVEEDKLLTTVNDLYDRMQGYNTRLINMPQKKDDLRYLDSYAKGFNDCLDEILGEEE